MEEGIPEEDICVCGVKHAIWFVRNSLDNIVEESEEINLIIANFLKEYHKLRIEQTLLG